jgi:hypothetical protein
VTCRSEILGEKIEVPRRRFSDSTLRESFSPSTPLVCKLAEKNATRSDKKRSVQPPKQPPYHLPLGDFVTKIIRIDKCYISSAGLVSGATVSLPSLV